GEVGGRVAVVVHGGCRVAADRDAVAHVLDEVFAVAAPPFGFAAVPVVVAAVDAAAAVAEGVAVPGRGSPVFWVEEGLGVAAGGVVADHGGSFLHYQYCIPLYINCVVRYAKFFGRTRSDRGYPPRPLPHQHINPARTRSLPGLSRNRVPIPRVRRAWPRTRPQRERPPGSWPRNCWTRRNTPTPPGRCRVAPRPPALPPRPPAPPW